MNRQDRDEQQQTYIIHRPTHEMNNGKKKKGIYKLQKKQAKNTKYMDTQRQNKDMTNNTYT